MSRWRLPLGLIAPAALLALVTALGVLQYRWVGQVSERERDQLRQSLDRRAREFAADFDAEISRVFQTFRPAFGFKPADAAPLARKYDEWQSTSKFPGLVKTVYFAETAGQDIKLHRYTPTARSFEEVAWPDHLQPARSRLINAATRSLPNLGSAAGYISISVTPLMPNVPAVLIPEASGGQIVQPRSTTSSSGGRRGGRGAGPITERRRTELEASAEMVNLSMTVRTGHNYAIVELDKGFVGSDMLPALAERHFPESGSDSFRVSVSNSRAETLFSRGVSDSHKLDSQSADAAASLFNLRVETFRAAVAGPGVSAALTPGQATFTNAAGQRSRVEAPLMRVAPLPPPAQRPPAREPDRLMVIEQNSTSTYTGTELRVTPANWTLLLQHSAGSLDAAVAQIRRRNLLLSFGILSVLVASVGLVMLNARRSTKLAERQMDFVATVSHELRTPLAVIRSAAQNLSAGVVNDPGQAQRYGDLIETEGRRLTDMVEQVLDYAGINDGRQRSARKAVDAAALVRDVVASSKALPEAAAFAFDVRIDADVPAIQADEGAIRRALQNLIGNAIKHGGDGRWIGVTVTRGSGADAGSLVVAVSDRGRGISPGDLAHVFEAFYRGRHALDAQIRGNGLGLNLVKRIAESHDGRVTVTSAQGEGSTFTLILPAATTVALDA